MKKVIPEPETRGGHRDGSGRKKSRTKKKQVSYKFELNTLKIIKRFAKARSGNTKESKMSMTVALETIVAEHEQTLNKTGALWTWAGEQKSLDLDAY